ncbi:MAG: 3-deoxy-D-manno-octulosonic acid transferase [Candidatus Omnitrophota bacterium]
MFILYDLIFLLVALFYLPVYILRKKFHPGFIMRLGFLPKGLSLHRPIWIHAVSVGEVMAVKGLIEGLRSSYPEKRIVISTVTSTGNKIARSIAKEGDFVTYLPFDISFIVRKVIRRLNPALFIIAETELWPNLISCLDRNGIPAITVNGRISDSSFAGYLSVKFFIRPIFRKIKLFCVQSQRDKERLLLLGALAGQVRVTGNMKFDGTPYTGKIPDYTDLKANLGLALGGKLLVAGSTHPGEEEIILSAYKYLLASFPDLRLLIAPRHPEWAKETAKIVSRFNLRPVYISGLGAKCETCITTPVFILDTIGKLMDFYALADIVFVGGSLVRKGGHNIIEPAGLGKAVLFGPYMFNFRDIAELFLKDNAAVMVSSGRQLYEQVKLLLSNPQQISAAAAAGQKVVLENRGATSRNLGCLKEFLG